MRKSSIAATFFCSLLALFACSGEGGEPGTPTNPVETCTQAGEVCQLDGSKLGVCVEGCSADGEGCEHDCVTCAPQH